MSSAEFDGPREVRLNVAGGDSLLIVRGQPLPGTRLPFQNALGLVAALIEGQSHRGDAWRNDATGYHAGRAIAHLGRMVEGAGDEEDHLVHAAARLLMSLEVRCAMRTRDTAGQ